MVQAQHVLDHGVRGHGQLAQLAQVVFPPLRSSTHTFDQLLQSCRGNKKLLLFGFEWKVHRQSNRRAGAAMQSRALLEILHPHYRVVKTWLQFVRFLKCCTVTEGHSGPYFLDELLWEEQKLPPTHTQSRMLKSQCR